jgi:hypothetical protein
VSLSSIASLSMTQDSLFNELASTAKNSTTASVVPAADSPTVNSNNADGSSNTLANDLAALLQSLGSGDVNGAKAALKKVEADLQAQDPSNTNTSTSSTSSSSSPALTSSSSQSSNPLTNLLNSALNSGDTNSALQDLTTVLLAMGQGNGAALNVTA